MKALLLALSLAVLLSSAATQGDWGEGYGDHNDFESNAERREWWTTTEVYEATTESNVHQCYQCKFMEGDGLQVGYDCLFPEIHGDKYLVSCNNSDCFTAFARIPPHLYLARGCYKDEYELLPNFLPSECQPGVHNITIEEKEFTAAYDCCSDDLCNSAPIPHSLTWVLIGSALTTWSAIKMALL